MSYLANLPDSPDKKLAQKVRRDILDTLETASHKLSSEVARALLDEIYVDVKTMVVYKEMEDNYEEEIKLHACSKCGCTYEG